MAMGSFNGAQLVARAWVDLVFKVRWLADCHAAGEEWEKMPCGVAIALPKPGYYEWENFRQILIATIEAWETSHALNDPD